jgi:predicted NUDIX family NTP pyrophosphohydrolase
MPRTSAGLLMYRRAPHGLEVLLVHPGGPFWKGKDEGAWSIPKGEVQEGEELIDTARREFEEELGIKPVGTLLPLKPVRQKAGKVVHAWAFEGDCDPAMCRSNTFRVQWPPRSGKWVEYPEVDDVKFFATAEAVRKINPAQAEFIVELQSLVHA